MKTVSVNGRDYHWPRAPLVVICCDGSEPDYMEVAMTAGLMPNLKRIIAKGENLRGHSAIPSFTNPNNLSIVTGRPPAVHGICGNYLIDPATGQETMMNDPKWLRAPTIFAAFQKAGARVAVVTAKDKLRLLLGKGLVFDGTAVAFSSEKADKATLRGQRHREPLRTGRHGRAGCLLGRTLGVRLRGRREAAGQHASPTSCICRPPTMCSTSMRRGRTAPTASTP